MRFQGKLSSWDDAKGIGTITWHGSSDRLFVHVSAFVDRRRRPVLGDILVYEAEKDAQGRFRAKNVSYPSAQLPPRGETRADSPAFVIWLVVTAIVSLAVAFATAKLPLATVGLYALASLVGFVAYWIDKRAAEAGRWRISDGTLHLIALFGGWPGAFAAQRLLRHKNRKFDFQLSFAATVLAHLLLVAWCVSQFRD